ncbi:MAG: uracil-DNA glycosylase [Pyrinomonadaceae bacterium]
MNSEITELILDVRERLRYLSEMGVETLDVDLPERQMSTIAAESHVARTVIPEVQIPKTELPATSTPEVSRLASLPSLARRKPLFPVVTPNGPSEPSAPETVRSPEPIGTREAPAARVEFVNISVSTAVTEMPPAIAEIRAEIGNCVRCPLHVGRKNIAHSTGNFDADLMFVGEAPGADEDLQGVPFVGRAGQLLTKIIEGIGMQRGDCFIGNINRCRPPGNRAPEPAEAAICKPFLFREIEAVKPRVIVVLGATAAQNLLQTKVPISKLRGQFHDYLGVKVMPTFHPAYLLRDPHKKREVWEDMKMVRDYLNAGE